MSSSAEIARVLQLVSVIGTAHLGGWHFASDKVAVPNALALDDTDAAVKGWFRAWDVGRKYGPTMVMAPTIGFAAAALIGGYDAPAFAYNVAASALLGLVTPYTVLVVFPVNDKLLAEHDRLLKQEKTREQIKGPGSEKVKGWVADWKRMDANRMVLAHLAIVAGAFAVFST